MFLNFKTAKAYTTDDEDHFPIILNKECFPLIQKYNEHFVHSYPRPSKLYLQSFYKPTLNQSKIYISTIETRYHSDCDNLGGPHLPNIPNQTQFWNILNPKYA